jgi:hypothetical protein
MEFQVETKHNSDDNSSSNVECFEFQLRMLEKGADAIQRHIERIDEVLFKVKASGVTVWVALIGWSFTSKNDLLMLLGFVVILGFWLLEGYFRGIQARYLASSTILTRFLNDEQALNTSFENYHLPPRIVYPMTFDEDELEKLRMYGKGLIAPSVAILYLFLAFVNYLLWLVAGGQS